MLLPLSSFLPPFAPDYGGASSVFFDYGGTIIINGASGCLSNCAGYDEPRYLSKRSVILSSGLRDVRAIFGDEDFLVETIPQLESLPKSNFLLLLSSPAACVIGTDHFAVASIVEENLDIPVFGIETMGINSYDKGIAMAVKALADRYLFSFQAREKLEDKTIVPGKAAILGMTPIDWWGRSNFDSVAESLENAGLDLACIIGYGGTINDIEKLAECEYVFVANAALEKIARKISSTFGCKLCFGLPAGEFYANNAYEFIGDIKENSAPEGEKTSEILVIAEQIVANSYRLALEKAFPSAHVTVATLFSFQKKLARPGDIKIEYEDETMELLRREVDVCVADPLLLEFNKAARCLVPLPHMAVSSRLTQDSKIQFAGEQALDEFKACIEKSEVNV